jgi:methanesulfonate monooxygenase subunit beta
MNTELSSLLLRRDVEQVVYSTCLHLDESRFSAFLELTADDFRYRITAYHPELGKPMTWLEHDRAGLSALFELLPKHHLKRATWFRHVVLAQLVHEAPEQARARSSLAIYHTQVDVGDASLATGASRLFAIGRYCDTLRLVGGRWLLSERDVHLETRQLGIGTHLII